MSVGPVRRLVPTSGTGSARKLIPWTDALGEEFSAALAAWVGGLFSRLPQLRCGRAYWAISPLEEAADHQRSAPSGNAAVPVGCEEDSAYLGPLLRRFAGSAMAVPAEVRCIRDPGAFAYATVLALLRARDLRLISVWHPTYLDLLLDAALTHRERLLADVAKGTSDLPAELPDVVRARLRAGPQPARARELSLVDWNHPRSLWPDLALVSCWGDASAAAPRKALERRLGGTEIESKGLLATEGAITIPFAGTHPLAINAHVYEFLGDDGRCRWPHETSVGDEYEVVISTGGGLTRYRLGDRVRVVGRLGATPCLRFLGRSGGASDLTGEKLDEALVCEAIAHARIEASFAALQPMADARPMRYRLVVDRDARLDGQDAARVDEALRRCVHYDLSRRLGQLSQVEVVISRRSAPELLIDVAGFRGQRLGEVKPPALLPADFPVTS